MPTTSLGAQETDALKGDPCKTKLQSYLSMPTRRGETRALVPEEVDEAQLHLDGSYSDDENEILTTSRVSSKINGFSANKISRTTSNFTKFMTWLAFLILFAVGIFGLATFLNVYKESHPVIISDNGGVGAPNSQTAGSGNSNTQPSTTEANNDNGDGVAIDEVTADKHHEHYVHYDPSTILQQIDPFDFDTSSKEYYETFGAGIFTAPRLFDNDHFYQMDNEDLMGYLQHPSAVNNTLVFCAEGDLYVTSTREWIEKQVTTSDAHGFGAMKLTTTDGNVLDPKINPVYPHVVAFTATYSGRREVYLMDLRGPRTPSLRLTYWDSGGGVSGLVGWTPDGTGLLIRSRSKAISMPDNRLYKLKLKSSAKPDGVGGQNGKGNRQRRVALSNSLMSNTIETIGVLEIEPVPLTQAIDAVIVESCIFFVRFSQSSQTIRYVGGTAESLWMYCEPQDPTNSSAPQAIPLLNDKYPGTSKSPQVYQYSGQNYLLFLSDRGYNENSKSDDTTTTESAKFIPDRMNIWALPIGKEGVGGAPYDSNELIQITNVACDFEGRVIREFVVDPITQHATLRIGADLYHLQASQIDQQLSTTGDNRRRQLHDFGHSPMESEPRSTYKETARKTESTSNSMPIDQGDFNETAHAWFMNNNSLPDEQGAKVSSSPSSKIYNEYKNGSDDPGILGTNDFEAERMERERLVSSHGTNSTQTPRTSAPSKHHHSGRSSVLKRFPIIIHSDFNNQHERIVPISMLQHMTTADVYETIVGTTHLIMTLRGQLWVSPVEESQPSPFEGAGMNLPPRAYRLAPGTMVGGLVRILAVRHVPNPIEDDTTDRRIAIILATDPMTSTAEHAFYLVETQPDASPVFMDLDNLPKPFLGGNVNGGATSAQGLGSVKPDSIVVSPCGRRMAWTDTDGRICAMTMPQYQDLKSADAHYVVLPRENEVGEPMVGDQVDLSWSPGGRYLAINHNARNQFRIISIVDCGDPTSSDEGEKVSDINVGRVVQATPSRFNSESMYFGKSARDIHEFARDQAMSKLFGFSQPDDIATTLFFLSDRDIDSDVRSPWGSRQPSPHFKKLTSLYALPFRATNDSSSGMPPVGRFVGGGAAELRVDEVLLRQKQLKALLEGSEAASGNARRQLEASNSLPFSKILRNLQHRITRSGRRIEESIDSDNAPVKDGGESNVTDTQGAEADSSKQINSAPYALDAAGLGDTKPAEFPSDMDIDFGPADLTFARRAYRLATIPAANYMGIICQTQDDGSFVLVEVEGETSLVLDIFFAGDYPSDEYDTAPFRPLIRKLAGWGLSTDRENIFLTFFPDGITRVVPTTSTGLLKLKIDTELDENVVDTDGLYLSIWPSLEYKQMYGDAWRMLRDYFYDPNMTGIDWNIVHNRYLPLVSRCTKREELDDVLAQMASELSALHVFVYGGEYNDPMHGDIDLQLANDVASFGAELRKNPEWKGFEIMSIPEIDPDFNTIDGGQAVYSPLDDHTMALSGQKGLKAGDVIVGVNGESVMRVPDINMLFRGLAGRSTRLEVLRLASGNYTGAGGEAGGVKAEAVIAVPLSSSGADDLRYSAWEWKTGKLAKALAKQEGFTVGYVHLQSMSGPQAEDAFARGFFPDYNKDAFILDVRHNRGGNIDSWVLSVLQRKPWMYWQSRDFNPSNGGLGWDEHYAFRGHLVVLIDEKTSSDGEGVARGISELGLGKLVGTRTWGGGIWLSSDNHLVDGGIATAPEVGTYSDRWGWGMGIEQMGVQPDHEVDNNPREFFEGDDAQLEYAIKLLSQWLKDEPVVLPRPPPDKKQMGMGGKECPAHNP